ncbi:PREDICTED: uncharacterized protein LOC101313802 [Fragaria vesca subsp. vesca]|uniref:uncharacterized protein LOC101313802 n=1 Tax=Fragaria vesca subsp. vesca TaxID=101020 RepID=UPI0002C31EF6|nr:PREDICTED: uncharacterized protein LOC101313802 [Fragaria vesca subsp. vesca]
MEEPQSAQSAQSGKLLRYGLRSVTKPKEVKLPAAELSNPSAASKRGRAASNVSKSVSVLDLSGKDKPVRPPRRLSIPNKVAGTPAPKLGGNITPVSEARSRRSVKSETPASDASRLTSRKKFSILSSESYWLSQIKLSEAAGRHSVSLGFFKLALEAGCEQPLQRMRDELKAYALRHKIGDLADLAVPLKELFESYGVVENEQVQVSETCSHVPEEGTRSSDEDAKSSSSTMGTRKLKPKSLNTDIAQVTPVINKPKKEVPQKSIPAARTRASAAKKSSTSAPVSDSGTQRSAAKKPQKPIKQEAKNEKDRKKQGKSAVEQGSVIPTSVEEALNENKENEDAASMEEINLTEVA